MNLRGLILHKYKENRFSKEYSDRYNKLLVSCYILANRDKIKKETQRLYNYKNPYKEVLYSLFFEFTFKDIVEVNFLEMGLKETVEDIENDLVIDYFINSSYFKTELKKEVKRIIDSIDNKTKKINYDNY